MKSRASLNRLYAHEAYLEEVVNTVDKSDNKQTSKVKPGQMNIFNFRENSNSNKRDI